MTVRSPLVLVGGKIEELPASDVILGAPAGPTGATGSTGIAGVAATISVGTVTTGAAGSSATVTNSGTSSAAVFDFSIPQGATGASGAGAWWPSLTVPSSASFATFGSGITVTDKSDRMQLAVTSGTTLRGQTLASISTPYTIDLGGGIVGTPTTNDALWFGLVVSDGTKFRAFYAGSVGSSTANQANIRAAIDSWTNATTFSATVRATPMNINPSAFFLRLTDNGTTRTFYISANAKDFVQIYSEATNTFVTPSKFGMAVYNSAANSVTAKANVQHWLVSSSVLGDAS